MISEQSKNAIRKRLFELTQKRTGAEKACSDAVDEAKRRKAILDGITGEIQKLKQDLRI